MSYKKWITLQGSRKKECLKEGQEDNKPKPGHKKCALNRGRIRKNAKDVVQRSENQHTQKLSYKKGALEGPESTKCLRHLSDES